METMMTTAAITMTMRMTMTDDCNDDRGDNCVDTDGDGGGMAVLAIAEVMANSQVCGWAAGVPRWPGGGLCRDPLVAHS